MWFDQAAQTHDEHATLPRVFTSADWQSLRAIRLSQGTMETQLLGGAGDWHYADMQARDARSGDFIAARLAMLGVARVEREFPVATAQRVDYGLAQPRFTVEFSFAQPSSKTRRLSVGAIAPDGFGQYVLSEPDQHVIVIPTYQVANLRRLIERS